MQVDMTITGCADKRGRFLVPVECSMLIGDPRSPELIGVGVIPGKKGSQALVYEHGATQTAIPLYGVSQAIGAGKVLPATGIVSAFNQAGNLDALRKALKAHDDALAKAAAAAAK